MTPDQEKMIGELASGDYWRAYPHIHALAQVVLELVKDSHPPVDIRAVIREEALRDRVDRHQVENAPHSLRLQMENAVADMLMREGTPNAARCAHYAKELVDSLLDILDCEPPMAAGHVVENRQGAALAYRTIIQAIRRGE